MSNLNGWYSAKYDSTKQRLVMTHGESGIKSYITSIRFELLLAGKVILTDSQWYDGLYFVDMALKSKTDKTFEDFLNFVRIGIEHGNSPVEVKRRTNIEHIFNKAFIYSSICDAELASFLEEEFGNNPIDRTRYSTLEEFFVCAEKVVITKRSDLLDSFLIFKEGVLILHTSEPRIFVDWNKYADFCTEFGKVCGNLIEMLNNNITVSMLGKSQKEAIAEIENQLRAVMPNRSIVTEKLDVLEKLMRDSGEFKKKFLHIFDNTYNYAIAKQHDCKYYDLYDAISNVKYHTENGKSVTVDEQKFHQKIVEYLGLMSWTQFGELFYDEEIVQMRNEWLAAFDSGNVEEAQKTFLAYLNCIVHKSEELGILLIENSIFYRRSGTKRFYFFEAPTKMVGGAGTEEHTEADSVCLFFGGGENKLNDNQIVRYATTEDFKETFDTVFAPIEKVIIESGN